jgi:hypothetical protein
MYKLDKISSTCEFSKIPNPIPLSLTTRQAQVPVGLAKCQAQSIGFRYILSPNAYKFDMVSNPTPLGLLCAKPKYLWVWQNAKPNPLGLDIF